MTKQMIDIIETVYRGASKGRGLVVSPKGNSNLNRLFEDAQPLLPARLLYTLSVLRSRPIVALHPVVSSARTARL